MELCQYSEQLQAVADQPEPVSGLFGEGSPERKRQYAGRSALPGGAARQGQEAAGRAGGGLHAVSGDWSLPDYTGDEPQRCRFLYGADRDCALLCHHG